MSDPFKRSFMYSGVKFNAALLHSGELHVYSDPDDIEYERDDEGGEQAGLHLSAEEVPSFVKWLQRSFFREEL